MKDAVRKPLKKGGKKKKKGKKEGRFSMEQRAMQNVDPVDFQTTWTDTEEIFRHTSREDMWLLIENKVYDVTKFGHPGGKQILQ